MKRLVLWMLALGVLSGSALFAQNITGTWQGTLHTPGGRDLRIVIKVSVTETDTLQAVLYSIDQGGQGTSASATLKGSAVTIKVPAIGGTYQGSLNRDATTIAGTWTQGPQPLTLNLTRATPETAWTIPPPPPRLKPVPANANPSFEVATIKPSKPESRPGKYFRVNGRRFSTYHTTLDDIMSFTYGIQQKQIVGGPAWMRTDKYDLLAEPAGEGQPNDHQLKIMVQKLLADRFQLKFHKEKQELSVYAITIAKQGPKLTKSQGDPNGLPGLFFSGIQPAVLNVRNATMVDFAGLMQSAVLDRPVVDQTGLSGRYDFTLTWTPDQFQFVGSGITVTPPADTANAPPGLFTAIQKQLGLRLKSTKAPAEVLVIDHVETPYPN